MANKNTNRWAGPTYATYQWKIIHNMRERGLSYASIATIIGGGITEQRVRRMNRQWMRAVKVPI